MKKSDLRTGHIVTTREGSEYVVYLGIDTSYWKAPDNVIVNEQSRYWNDLKYYNEDLTYYDKDRKCYDIMKVERGTSPFCLQNKNYNKADRETLWEREEVKEMTVAEIEKLLGHPIKIVK